MKKMLMVLLCCAALMSSALFATGPCIDPMGGSCPETQGEDHIGSQLDPNGRAFLLASTETTTEDATEDDLYYCDGIYRQMCYTGCNRTFNECIQTTSIECEKEFNKCEATCDATACFHIY